MRGYSQRLREYPFFSSLALGVPRPKARKMKRKIKTVRLLANFFRDEYYGAYKELIRQLSPLLQNPDQLPSQITRLDFKPDLPRGTKKLIYQHIARLLQSGDGVFRKPYCRNDLYRWLAGHTNLGASERTIERRIQEQGQSQITGP